MSKTRLLPAALLVVLPLVGCAAGQKDATSQEHATPYVANAQVGGVLVRNVVIIPATGASPSPTAAASTGPTASPGASPSASSSPSSGTGPQAYLSMVLLGNTDDELTGASIEGGGNVAPTDPTAQFLIRPNIVTSIVDPETGASGPALAITGLPNGAVLGTALKVTLVFRNAGQVTVAAPVRALPTT